MNVEVEMFSPQIISTTEIVGHKAKFSRHAVGITKSLGQTLLSSDEPGVVIEVIALPKILPANPTFVRSGLIKSSVFGHIIAAQVAEISEKRRSTRRLLSSSSSNLLDLERSADRERTFVRRSEYELFAFKSVKQIRHSDVDSKIAPLAPQIISAACFGLIFCQIADAESLRKLSY